MAYPNDPTTLSYTRNPRIGFGQGTLLQKKILQGNKKFLAGTAGTAGTTGTTGTSLTGWKKLLASARAATTQPTTQPTDYNPDQLQTPFQDDKLGIGNLQDFRGIRSGQPVNDPLAVGNPVPSRKAIFGGYDKNKPGSYPAQKGGHGKGKTLHLAKHVLGSTTGNESIRDYYGDQYDEVVKKADHHNWMEKVFGGGKQGYIKDRLGQRVEVWRDGKHPTLGTNFGGKAKKSPGSINAQAYYQPLPNPHGQSKGNTYAGFKSQNPFRSFLESNNLWFGDPEQADPIKRPANYPTAPEGENPALDRARAMSGETPFIRLNRIVDLKGGQFGFGPGGAWTSPGTDKRSLEHEIMHHVQAGTKPGSRIGNEKRGTYALPELDNNLPEGGNIFEKPPPGLSPRGGGYKPGGYSHMFSNSAELIQGVGQLRRQWFKWTKAEDAARRGVPANEGKGRLFTASDLNKMLKGKVGEGVPAHFKKMGKWRERAGEAPTFIEHFQIFHKNFPKKAAKLTKELIRIMGAVVDAKSPQGEARKHMLDKYRRGRAVV